MWQSGKSDEQDEATFMSDSAPIHADLGVVQADRRAPRRGDQSPDATLPHASALTRATMAGVTAFITINIWTGAPLLALWVGSQTVGRGTLSMGAVGVVVVVLAVLEFVLAVALTWLNNVYDRLIGRPHIERRAAWMRSMRAEAEGHVEQRVGITLLERIVMVNVYLCVISLVVWYVFFAGAPTPIL